MNLDLTLLEVLVVGLGLAVLLIDLWMPAKHRRFLGYGVAAALGGILLLSFGLDARWGQGAFGNMYLLDPLALFFKRFFLMAGILVILLIVEHSDRIPVGLSEYYALTLFALAGMMFAASANDLIMLFVSLELITVTFYILASFERSNSKSLEAGVKYLLLGALSTGFTVFGIALVFGSSGATQFDELARRVPELLDAPLLLVGFLLILSGLGFKIAAAPFQIWAPDVYEGSPAPTTAFLAVGSKAAGFVLIIRLFIGAASELALSWENLWMSLAGLTILVGNLCALPQRNLKRLLGYSSIANAGYLLLGIAAMSSAGSAAVLYYLTGYLFTVIAAMSIICLVLRNLDSEDISGVAGLHQRAPFVAAVLTLSMVSLAGIPPLAGFFGKFMLLKALLEQAGTFSAYYVLLLVAVCGVVMSIYYYFGVIRTIYWGQAAEEAAEISISPAVGIVLGVCALGMLYLGVFPNGLVEAANAAVAGLFL